MRGITNASNVAALLNPLFAKAVKPGKVKQIMFFGDNAVLEAATQAAQVLGQVAESESEVENARELRRSAVIDGQYLVQQMRDSKLTIEPSAKKQGSLAREIMERMIAQPAFNVGGKEEKNGAMVGGTLSKYGANLLSDLRHAVNVSGKFTLNHQRANGGKGKSGKVPLIQKSDSAYSLNLKADTPAAKAVDALKQLGVWFKARAPKGADVSNPYLQIGAYLTEIDTEVKA